MNVCVRSEPHVPVSKISPVLSEENTSYYTYTQKIAVLIGNDSNGKEVNDTIRILQKYGVFIDVVSERFGTLLGTDGTEVEVDKTFVSTYPVLYDSIYVVGGSMKNQGVFNEHITNYVNDAYKRYKPIGVATTGEPFIHATANNNLAGVVFAENNQRFGEEFVTAVAQQRFWNRT